MARRDRLRKTPGATPGERRSPCLSNRGTLCVGRPGALSMSVSTWGPAWAEYGCHMASCGGPLAAFASSRITHESVDKGPIPALQVLVALTRLRRLSPTQQQLQLYRVYTRTCTRSMYEYKTRAMLAHVEFRRGCAVVWRHRETPFPLLVPSHTSATPPRCSRRSSWGLSALQREWFLAFNLFTWYSSLSCIIPWYHLPVRSSFRYEYKQRDARSWNKLVVRIIRSAILISCYRTE